MVTSGPPSDSAVLLIQSGRAVETSGSIVEEEGESSGPVETWARGDV